MGRRKIDSHHSGPKNDLSAKTHLCLPTLTQHFLKACGRKEVVLVVF